MKVRYRKTANEWANGGIFEKQNTAMPTVNFYLKKPEGNPPRSLIYLQMKYHGQKLVYSTKFNIDPAWWDINTQSAGNPKKMKGEDRVRNGAINRTLVKLKDICLDIYHGEIANGIPTNATFKAALDAHMHKNVTKEKKAKDGPALFALIEKFISGEIGDKKSASTIKTYITAKNSLLAFQEDTGYKVDFETISLEFKYSYVSYLEKERYATRRGKRVKVPGLSPNSVQKEIKNIRTFMNMANELGYTKNIAHKSKKFSVKGEITDAVYLTDSELKKLYRVNLSENKRLEAVRDLFVFSSYVGLRYSDASNIKPENIVQIDGEDYIKIKPKKTIKSGMVITIPCNKIVLEIFEKYSANSNRLPPAVSNQKYNQYLKEVCQLAGLTEAGRLSSDLNKPLFECITSHTGRRNFATNCYLAGMDTKMIMAVTGHSTESSFMKYIKVTRQETAKRMGDHMKKSEVFTGLKAVI